VDRGNIMTLEKYTVQKPFSIMDSDTQILPKNSFRSFELGSTIFEFEAGDVLYILAETSSRITLMFKHENITRIFDKKIKGTK
jgi:hypothetical protein